MSSMSPDSETMFLTVITGESVERHYKFVLKALYDERVNWNLDLLNEPMPINPPSGSGAHPLGGEPHLEADKSGVPVCHQLSSALS